MIGATSIQPPTTPRQILLDTCDKSLVICIAFELVLLSYLWLRLQPSATRCDKIHNRLHISFTLHDDFACAFDLQLCTDDTSNGAHLVQQVLAICRGPDILRLQHSGCPPSAVTTDTGADEARNATGVQLFLKNLSCRRVADHGSIPGRTEVGDARSAEEHVGYLHTSLLRLRNHGHICACRKGRERQRFTLSGLRRHRLSGCKERHFGRNLSQHEEVLGIRHGLQVLADSAIPDRNELRRHRSCRRRLVFIRSLAVEVAAIPGLPIRLGIHLDHCRQEVNACHSDLHAIWQPEQVQPAFWSFREALLPCADIPLDDGIDLQDGIVMQGGVPLRSPGSPEHKGLLEVSVAMFIPFVQDRLPIEQHRQVSLAVRLRGQPAVVEHQGVVLNEGPTNGEACQVAS
mmetsp:Transcript_168273/g.540625  ORF Transcript_168273/g.540625 Transcript_168273/m.540625 type:complete len:402 (-) Transcript_168273:668-1873(-)